MDPLLVEVATARSVLYYGAIYAVVVAVAVWIYRDARGRDAGSPWLWALATLLLTILPVILYLFLRSRGANPGDGG